MGKRMPETCWAVFERRAINLRDWCIWLVHLFECWTVLVAAVWNLVTRGFCASVYADDISCVTTVHDGHSGAKSGGPVWTLCCIVDGYYCCVVERHCFFYVQNCGMYCMQVSCLFHRAESSPFWYEIFVNPLNPELNPICYLLALLGAHHFLHVSRIRVKYLTFRLLMLYIYGAPILDVSRSHTKTQHSR
jgi:hypothetical protein